MGEKYSNNVNKRWMQSNENYTEKTSLVDVECRSSFTKAYTYNPKSLNVANYKTHFLYVYDCIYFYNCGLSWYSLKFNNLKCCSLSNRPENTARLIYGKIRL